MLQGETRTHQLLKRLYRKSPCVSLRSECRPLEIGRYLESSVHGLLVG